MKLYIKHMVSLRCKLFVQKELEKLGLTCFTVNLGMVEIEEEISDEMLEIFNNNLKKSGLEILYSKKRILVEKIKTVIVEMIHHSNEVPKMNDSDYISQKLGYDYTYLSHTFSEAKGMTIQQYIILHRIEKVKEMLMYNELTLTEIAYKLHYSSVAHLSYQFKKVTDLTPTYYKEMKEVRENNIEEL
ncbi:AraC family transcriptional regulator [Rhodohalobacter sp. SW132]|uniref:helix-turn-helix domain-containing protein n=1 Tax=Rhodohalobacter sp. SW132 TaxID=2293433 RepID=UPI000E279CCB|nr:AraC family transcriptional regulator [Rhodohalobacter sp. SW132]REL32929.1 AraC family transcriptional regulator [Rhodohalobacter sp. SW132]